MPATYENTWYFTPKGDLIMSLSLSSIRYLAWLHLQSAMSGPVLLLGRKMVFGSVENVV